MKKQNIKKLKRRAGRVITKLKKHGFLKKKNGVLRLVGTFEDEEDV